MLNTSLKNLEEEERSLLYRFLATSINLGCRYKHLWPRLYILILGSRYKDFPPFVFIFLVTGILQTSINAVNGSCMFSAPVKIAFVELRTKGINYNESLKMKNHFIIPNFFNCIQYLTCIASFYMQAQSVYPWAWSLYLQVRCMGLLTMKPGQWKVNLIPDFFIYKLYKTRIASFLCRHDLHTCGNDLYTHGNVLYTNRCDVYTCKHDLYKCRYDQHADTYGRYLSIFSHRREFLSWRINFYHDWNFQPWDKFLPYWYQFLLWQSMFVLVLIVKWLQIIWQL